MSSQNVIYVQNMKGNQVLTIQLPKELDGVAQKNYERNWRNVVSQKRLELSTEPQTDEGTEHPLMLPVGRSLMV